MYCIVYTITWLLCAFSLVVDRDLLKDTHRWRQIHAISRQQTCFSFFMPQNPSINHLNFYSIKQIDNIFPCVCTEMDHRRCHSAVFLLFTRFIYPLTIVYLSFTSHVSLWYIFSLELGWDVQPTFIHSRILGIPWKVCQHLGRCKEQYGRPGHSERPWPRATFGRIEFSVWLPVSW